MKISLTPTLLLTIQAISFWPVWQWYMLRITDQSDEPWGIVALVTAIALLLAHRNRRSIEASDLVFPCFMVLAYFITYPFAPALGRAAFAILGIASTLCPYFTGQRFKLAIWGLFILSLPVLPTLQFYLGYPLRTLTAYASVPLIELVGYDVSRDGTMLRFAGELVLVDAPCSGIKMLWGIWYLNYTLAALFSLSLSRTLISQLIGAALLFVGNVLRTTILFFIESQILPAPAWAHQAVGLIIFGVVALCLVFTIQELKVRCVT